MSEPKARTLLQRSDQLREAARKTHRGIFLTGPNRIELLSDDLPESSFGGRDYLLASLGNCRCASDAMPPPATISSRAAGSTER